MSIDPKKALLEQIISLALERDATGIAAPRSELQSRMEAIAQLCTEALSSPPPVREAALREALEKIASYGNTDRRVTDPESGAESSAIKLSAMGHLKCRLIAQAALAEGGKQ